MNIDGSYLQIKYLYDILCRKLPNRLQKKFSVMLKAPLFTLVIVSLVIFNAICTTAFATSVGNGYYWYNDDNIRNIVKSRINNTSNTPNTPKVHIAPALPFGHKELLTEILVSSINEVRSGSSTSSLIPVNFGNAHWVSLAIKSDASGSIKAIYNDPLGHSISNHPNSQLLLSLLGSNSVELIDLQLLQQYDGSSCGAFTAENLVKIANLDITNLDKSDLSKHLLVGNANVIRKLHQKLLDKFIGDKLIQPVNNELTVFLSAHSNNMINQISSDLNLVNLAMDSRLNDLSFNQIIGVNAGSDKILESGIWFKILSGSTSKKNNIFAYSIGADTLFGDSVIGIAYSNLSNILKISNLIDSNSSSNSKSVTHIATLYGDTDFNSMNFSGNINYGKILNKTDRDPVLGVNANDNIKTNIDIFSVNGSAGYNIKLNHSLLITPKLNFRYNYLSPNSNSKDKNKDDKTMQTFSAGPVIAFSSFIDLDYVTLSPKIHIGYIKSLWSNGNARNLFPYSSYEQSLMPNSKFLNFKSHSIAEFGSSLTIASDILELSIGYERYIQKFSKKSIASNVGFLQMRMNF